MADPSIKPNDVTPAAGQQGVSSAPRARLLLVGKGLFRRFSEEATDGSVTGTLARSAQAPGASPRDILLGELAESCRFVVVKTMEEALEQLAHGDFAGVFSDAGDFLPLKQAMLGEQASNILNTIGEGVCIVDASDRCIWMNRKMQNWPPPVHEHIRRVCGDAFRHFAGITTRPPEAGSVPEADRQLSKRYQITVDDAHFLELIASPVLDSARRPQQIVCVVFDATGNRKLQQKLDAIDKAGAQLVKIESESVESMTMAERLKLLEEKVISVTRDLMHFDHFNLRLIDPTSDRLELVVASGLPAEALDVELYTGSESNGISGHVAKTGRSYICADVRRDPRYVAGLDGALSSLTVPLTLDDKVIGVFNIESRRAAAFNEDDRQFAEIFGRYVAIALSILKLIVTERAATNKKVADDVCAEVAGPLNDIALDAAGLLDEFIGQDALRQKLQGILDNVDAIRGSLRQAAAGPQTVLGTREIQAEPAIDPQLAGARVLVVDDETNIRETITDVLRKYRVEVVAETHGSAAIERLRETVDDAPAFDLVLSDIKMPNGTGYDVFAAARRLPAPPPVILMTGFGYDPNHCIVRASQEGLQAVLFKPFRVEQLLQEVRRAVARPVHVAAL